MKVLYWYLNYCCCDDYGVGYEYVFVWVGLYYFLLCGGYVGDVSDGVVLIWFDGLYMMVMKLSELIVVCIGLNVWLCDGFVVCVIECVGGVDVLCVCVGYDGMLLMFMLKVCCVVCVMLLFVVVCVFL